MKGDSIPAGHGADAFPAIRRQNHATLQLRENRSVARSVASPDAEIHQNRGKAAANTFVSAENRSGTGRIRRTLHFDFLDTRSVASKRRAAFPLPPRLMPSFAGRRGRGRLSGRYGGSTLDVPVRLAGGARAKSAAMERLHCIAFHVRTASIRNRSNAGRSGMVLQELSVYWMIRL